jgi:hypothetical protein
MICKDPNYLYFDLNKPEKSRIEVGDKQAGNLISESQNRDQKLG